MTFTESALRIIAPHNCLGCGREDWLVCPWCRGEILPVPSRCYRCKAASTESAVCQKCRKTSSLKNVWVVTDYTGLAKRLIHVLKFTRASAAAQDIGAMLDDILPYLPKGIVVVHVPTATSRRRQRGYDQAERIAKCIARKKALSHAPLLIRMGQTRQVGAKKEQRMHQLRDAYRLSGAVEDIPGVLLVDDVLTTGASLEAAAAALKQAGIRHIDACVFAQK